MTEDECRVSYRDAKDIIREAEKPYVKAMLLCFGVLVVFIIAMILSNVLNSVFPQSLGEDLQHLVDTGQLTEETARYLFDEGQKSSYFHVLTGAIVSMLMVWIPMIGFSKRAVKKALKEENERRASE